MSIMMSSRRGRRGSSTCILYMGSFVQSGVFHGCLNSWFNIVEASLIHMLFLNPEEFRVFELSGLLDEIFIREGSNLLYSNNSNILK